MSNDTPLPPVNPHAMAAQAAERTARRIKESFKKIDEILGPDRVSLQEAAQYVFDRDAGRQPGMRQRQTFDEGTEARMGKFMQHMKPVVLENAKFKIITVLKEAGGKEIDMWQVRDSNNNKVGPVLRREDDAKLLAAFLNETNDVNDPRASALIDLVNRENSLLAQRSRVIREAKVASSASQKRALTEQADVLKGQIQQVRVKLGVSG